MSKIPQGEWNAIAARYQGGESISNIARSYGCTPPAIHYILKRSQQKPAAISPQPNASPAPTSAPNGFRATATDRAVGLGPLQAESSAAGRTVSEATASLPQDAPTAALRSERLSPVAARPLLVRARGPEPAASAQSPAPLTHEAVAPPAPLLSGSRDTAPAPARTGATPPAILPGLDDALHLRAEAAIALFRSSFDQALVEGSPDVRERLRQAANDLMRVAARTTIVLDRLDATTERSARAHDYPRSAHAGDDLGKLGQTAIRGR
jgi:Meckel syndrome type 1 protein